MLINEVEAKVGLSKKSIRYYEDNGLLTISRNSDNDYRVYTEADILLLKRIKFLRELGVPIKELQAIKNNTLSLKDCLEDRIHKIDAEMENYTTVKSMCEEIIKNNDEFDSIDITKYFQNVNILNKEGFTLRDVRTNKSKKIIGAIVSSLIFSSILIFVIALISYFQFTEADKLSWISYGILVGIIGLPLLAIVYNLVSRIKEILGGEEDEASKY